MKKHLFQPLVLLLSFSIFGYSQNTVGLLSYNPIKAFDGYNLIYPHNQSTVYLLDNCGEVVHTWGGEEGMRPGNTAYLLEDGRMLMTTRSALVTNDPIWAGGGGTNIEIRDWDNTITWSYTLNDSLYRLHHDVEPIFKNGKLSILAIAWENKNLEEVIAAGRDTSVLESGELWPDYIFEIDTETNEIVWEWHAWDHLVQDHDSTKANYGVIVDNPNKIDINLDNDGSGNADWMHANALDYDPINDQVLLCVPNFDEVYIIDHTTTTAEAATSSGGFGNRGGDLMYRWGNDANFGGTAEQKLFFQHDAHFINDFISPVDPFYNKLAVFNNRAGADYSTVNIFDPAWDMYSWEFPFDGEKYGPSEFALDLKHPVDSTLQYSTGLSSVQYLPNTNLLICVGRTGYAYEMTKSGEIVWEYKVPLIMGLAATQGDTLTVNNNLTFRIQRYPSDYPAFEGRDLSVGTWIELNPDTTLCDAILPVRELAETYQAKIYPNPTRDRIALEWENSMFVDIEILNVVGQVMYAESRVSGGMKYIDVSDYEDGLYVVRLNGLNAGRFVVSE